MSQEITRVMASADAARLLAACFYQPSADLADERVFATLAAAAGQIDPALTAQANRLGTCFADESLQTLLVDYTRLFLGPTQILAKPYGSYWLTGEHALMQDATVAVRELYREGGFDIDDDFAELPDHVAAELEFLYLLLFREAEARQQADSARAEAVTALRRRFLHAHLGRWIAPFTQAMRDGAQTAFYRELADLTERYVRLQS